MAEDDESPSSEKWMADTPPTPEEWAELDKSRGLMSRDQVLSQEVTRALTAATVAGQEARDAKLAAYGIDQQWQAERELMRAAVKRAYGTAWLASLLAIAAGVVALGSIIGW